MTTPTVGRVRAWTLPVIRLPGDVIAHKWGNDWTEEPRLIPESDTLSPGSRGNASFRLLRAQRIEPDGPDTSTTDLVTGQYVAITAGVDAFAWASVVWWGFISSISTTPLGLYGDQMGTVSALEVGHLLATVEASGWTRTNGMGGTDAFDFQDAPDCNLRGPAGEIIGNRVELSGNSLFARASASCGTDAANYWTRWRLGNHVVTYCVPDFLPTLTLSAPTDVSDLLDDTTIKEVFTVKGLSLLAIFDLIFPRSRGLSWKIVGSASTWTVTGYSTLVDGEDGIPVQTPVNIDLGPTSTRSTRSVSYTDDDTTTYDEIEVRGGQILFGGTVSKQLDNSDKGWTASQETLYKAGAKGGTGYSALTLTKQREADESARNLSAVKDVYARFVIGDQSSGGMYQYDSPTSPSGSQAFFPAAQWDGDALTFDAATYYDPQWPSTALARNIPWPKGKKADATDLRSDNDKTKPQYLKPLAFYQDTPRWIDLSGKEDRRGKASIGIDDRGCAITVEFSPSEWFAKADWSGSDGSPIIPDPSVNFSALDWRYAFFTVAIPSGQILAVRKRRSGIEAANVRRRLVVEYPELECWVMHAGSILGIDEDGAPEVLATRTVVRNDFPIAERIAKQVAAYALTTRSAATIELDRPDAAPTWATLGTIIGTVTDGAHAKTLNSCVEMVTHTWGAKPRVSIRTDLPESPSFSSGLAKGGSGGGTSATLGGTVGQSIMRLREEVNEQGARTQNAPLSFGFAGESIQEGTSTDVHAEAHGLTDGTVVYFGGSTWAPVDGTVYESPVATLGIITNATDDDFTVVTAGLVEGLTGLTAGVLYYADASGALSATVSHVGILVAATATSGYIFRRARFAKASKLDVSQSGHGFTLGNAIHLTGGSWAKAKDDDATDAVGLVTRVADANNFTVTLGGVGSYAGATVGTMYYLGGTAGTLTSTRPAPGFGERIRAVAVGIESDLVHVLPAALIDAHEHVVEDDSIPYVKLEDLPEIGVLGSITGGTPTHPIEFVSVPNDGSVYYLRGQVGGLSNQMNWSVLSAADLGTSGVTPGSYGSGTLVPYFTVSASGVLTDAGTFTPSLAGDVTGDLGASVVEAIQGVPVDATAPTDQQALIYNDSAGSAVWADLVEDFGQLLTWGYDSVTMTDRVIQLEPGDAGTFLQSNGDSDTLTWEFPPFLKIGDYSTKTTLTSSSGTHNFTAGKTHFVAVIIAAGAGGQTGSAGTGSASFAGGGGGGGETVVVFGRIVAASMTYVVGSGGAAGTGGSGGGGLGTNGGNSSITLDGDTITSYGGGADGSSFTAGGVGGRHGVTSTTLDTLFQAGSMVGFSVPGADGHGGRVEAITHAAGAISSYSAAKGNGGYSIDTNGSGKGGNGGAAGANGSAGADGKIIVFEI